MGMTPPPMQRMPPPSNYGLMTLSYRRYLLSLPIKHLLNDRGSWTQHGYHGWLNKEDRTKGWREVVDELTLLRPAMPVSMSNRDLLIAR